MDGCEQDAPGGQDVVAIRNADPTGDQTEGKGSTGNGRPTSSARLRVLARLARPRRLGIIVLLLVSMVVAVMPIQSSTADPGSGLPGSPWNGRDAKLDTSPPVTKVEDPT